MNSIADRAKALLNDMDGDDLNIVSIGDVEQIVLAMSDRWDAMALMRAFGAAYFAASNKVGAKAKLLAFADLRARLMGLL